MTTKSMATKLLPVRSEPEGQEQADSYERWFRDKVESAMNSTKPRIPHKKVIAEIQSRLNAKRKGHNVG
ncbi:stability determinant [Budviciaceae bacterium CWB-B4]|uniref:Stability determinant n=2 Tax=Limnobaculum xujianqingii TaxID=2738837 RepID=A0A9D7FW69_9GAMM|nr:stability determinant [Limnobaculum xujianqingii]MBK5175310.1 stability determinant [Limnobaculum xujianqingii]